MEIIICIGKELDTLELGLLRLFFRTETVEMDDWFDEKNISYRIACDDFTNYRMKGKIAAIEEVLAMIDVIDIGWIHIYCGAQRRQYAKYHFENGEPQGWSDSKKMQEYN